MRIVVTGASGRLGRLVTTALLRRVPASALILVSRSPDKLASLAQRGAAVRYGDFERPDSMPAAFAGGRRALVISTIGAADTRAAHRAAFEAAARAGVQHIVYTSESNPRPGNPFPPARVHAASEQDLRSVGMAWTILRNSLYADFRAEIATAYIRDGRWTTNMGDGSHAFVTRADCAAAAAAALTPADQAPADQAPADQALGDQEGRVYEITGPELIDARHYLALLEAFGGRRITRVDVDDAGYERYRAAFMAQPDNAPYLELLTGTGQAIRTGYLSELSGAVRQLTGRPPSSLRSAFQRQLGPVTAPGARDS
jgi:NAD(P)H dehydrogenase (quinone)